LNLMLIPNRNHGVVAKNPALSLTASTWVNGVPNPGA